MASESPGLAIPSRHQEPRANEIRPPDAGVADGRATKRAYTAIASVRRVARLMPFTPLTGKDLSAKLYPG